MISRLFNVRLHNKRRSRTNLGVPVKTAPAKQRYLKAFAALSATSLLGCGALEPLKEATANIDKATANLEKGMKGLDPLALKKLMDENEGLRSAVQRLNAQMGPYNNSKPVSVLQGQLVKIEVLHYVGAFKLDAWIDTPENWVWKNRRFADLQQSLGLRPASEYAQFTLSRSLNCKGKQIC